MFGPQAMVASAKAYKKTPMQGLLDKAHIDSLRSYIRLPQTVKDAKPMLMMFIDLNPQLQSASPETVLNNLIQFAIAYQQFSGKMLNLTMEKDIAIPMPPPNPEEKTVKFETPPKDSPSDEEMDEDIRAQLDALAKSLKKAQRRKQLEAQLKKLDDE
jgi:hypothetical protein